MFRSLRSPGALLTTLLAAGILAITMGTRQSLGLFVSPLNSATGLGIATISLAMAIGAISLTTICTLSPGITISVPAGSSMLPVTSVVRK